MSIQTIGPRFLRLPSTLVKRRYRRDLLVDPAMEGVLGGVDIAAVGTDLALDTPARALSLGFCARYLWQNLKTSLPLLVADVAALAFCYGLATAVCSLSESSIPAAGIAGISWTFILMQPLIGAGIGLYPGVGLSPSGDLRLSSLATSMWIAVLMVMSSGHAGHPIGALALTWVLAVVSVPLARSLTRVLAAKFQWWGLPAIVLGGGEAAAAVYRSLLANPTRGLRPVGLIDHPHAHWNDTHVDSSWYLGPPAATAAIVDELGAFWGIIPLGSDSTSNATDIMDRHAAVFPHLLVLRDSSAGRRSCNGACDCGGLTGLRIDERLLLPQSQLIKRAMDFACALLGGVLLLPLLALIAIGVKISSPGPIFYGQKRVGRGGKSFVAWKFRSMKCDADRELARHLEANPRLRAEWEKTQKLKNDPRITGFGRLVRKTSLDELPQLWNVLFAEMSLVGPRPIVESEIVKYNDAFQLYARVRPGITGLWQVSGRNLTTYDQRVHLDATYVRNWSPWLDLYVLARTVRVVLFSEGAF